MQIDIRPSNLRDVSYVLWHLRPGDQDELLCQIDDGTPMTAVAYSLLHAEHSFTAYLDDKPVAIFGTSPITPACHSIWALGTPGMRRAVPAISRFMRDHCLWLWEQGVRTIEARSDARHLEAHRWMHLTGAFRVDPCFVYGKNGEEFVIFRWTEASIARIKR